MACLQLSSHSIILSIGWPVSIPPLFQHCTLPCPVTTAWSACMPIHGNGSWPGPRPQVLVTCIVCSYARVEAGCVYIAVSRAYRRIRAQLVRKRILYVYWIGSVTLIIVCTVLNYIGSRGIRGSGKIERSSGFKEINPSYIMDFIIYIVYILSIEKIEIYM